MATIVAKTLDKTPALYLRHFCQETPYDFSSRRGSRKAPQTVVVIAPLLIAFGALSVVTSAQDVCRVIRAPQSSGAWRREPLDPSMIEDDVPAGIRSARANYWRHHLPPPASTVFPAARGAQIEEIPTNADGVWVTATFESYKVYLAPDNYGPYTEMRLHVDNEIDNALTTPVTVGELIEIGEAGGTIEQSNGTARQYNLDLDPAPFELHHQYLLFLTYDSDTEYFAPMRRWDITSGKVIPDGPTEVTSCREHRSKLAGLSVSEAISRINATRQ